MTRAVPTKAGAYALQIDVTSPWREDLDSRLRHSLPVHIVSTLPPGLYNRPYSYQLRTLENQQPLIWTVSPTDRLPVGLKLKPDGLLSGIPAESGPFTFTLRANDVSATVNLRIDSGSLETYYPTREPPIPANVGAYFLGSLSVAGGVTFSLSSGVLPPGLELSPNGGISGTPTTAGVNTFKVRLDDGRGDFGIGVVTIRVGVTQSENRSLPGATTGVPYAAQVQGGTLAPGDSLPPGH